MTLETQTQTTSASINGYGYPSEWNMEQAFGNIHVTDKSLGRDKFSTNFGEPSHTQSWFGRINYSLYDRYLFTATMRADGSSKFAKGNKWGYFPSVSGAWVISSEEFMKDLTWLNELKFRVAIGKAGNNRIKADMWRYLYTTNSSGGPNFGESSENPSDLPSGG